ncbi:hypothetical protein ISN76_13145 [Dyella halodurans]|uniref:Uncharacterized protein n=1 Tax=Dyella halodurans TaxID=1920171 RepID=A0ABV9C1L4_9GAMM|nr:hypothetical protein [Dyella halodurans]
MNAGLSPSDLPPDVRDQEIERTIAQMRKSFALYRVTSFLNSLPAGAGSQSPPCGPAEAGAFFHEQHA